MRPDLFDDVDLMAEISIHAPAKGATNKGREMSDETKISIHAPAKGATKVSRANLLYINISIHAPAKGATG